MINRIFNSIFTSNGKTRFTIASAKGLFNNCKFQASKPEWFSKGLIGDNFRAKHTMLILHIWMVHKRLQQGDFSDNGSREGKNIQECLFDEVWEDTSARIRSMGINELSVNKNLSEVQSYSFKCCLELDHALTKSSEDEILDSMGGTLWRSVYNKGNIGPNNGTNSNNNYSDNSKKDNNKKENNSNSNDNSSGNPNDVMISNVTVEHVLELAAYIRNEQKSLVNNVSKEAILDGRIEWGPIPKWEATRKLFAANNKNKNKTVSIDLTHDHENNTSLWREAVAPDGKIYYWNIKTKESRWEKPANE